MSNLTVIILLALCAYLVGSLSFAVIISRLMGLSDPRSYGSGNPGATNVLRSGNKVAAVLTLLFDALKGLLPVFLLKVYADAFHLSGDALDWALAGVALAVFLGHLYPLFFKFQGGKGVATAAGVLFGLHPILGLATLATWLIMAVFFRYSSLAALASAVFAPMYYLLGDRVAWYAESQIFIALMLISAFLSYRHRANITRLLQGKEPRLGKK